MKVTVVLPVEEVYSPYYGGAIARWVHETYIRSGILNYSIICRQYENSYTPEAFFKGVSLINYLMKLPFIRRCAGYLSCFFNKKIILESDVIHLHNSFRYVKYIRMMGFKGRLLLHMHNDYLSACNIEQLKYIISNVDRIITCSNFLKDKIEERINTDKVSVLYNGVNTSLFINNKFESRKKNIVYVGRITEGKGLLILIKAFKKLLDFNDEYKLIVIGSGNFGGEINKYERLCAKVASELKDTVEFLGFLEHENIAKILSESRFFICPSIAPEAFGMVIIEAMASGVICAGSNNGGIPEIIKDHNFLFKNGDVDSLVEVLKKMVIISDDEYKLLSESTINYVNKFCWDNITQQMEEIIKYDA
ncbi:TPA: glycosyltransferase family 4 protein [Photobacterium damselae]